MAVAVAAGRLARDVRDQQRVLARMVGRCGGRVAAVVRGQHQQVVGAERGAQIRDRSVDLLQAAVEALRVVAVPVGLIRLDEIDEHEALAGLPRERDRAREAIGVRRRRVRVVDVAAGEDVVDLADARHVSPRPRGCG